MRSSTRNGVTTIFAARDELHTLDIADAEREKANADLMRAESRGFMYCEAVFVRDTYDGLMEKAHPTDGSFNWGRGQDIVSRFYFRDGKIERDPLWKAPPPAAAWESHGLQCEVRENGIGYLCGYVRLPVGHAYHGKHYNDIPYDSADVHGGLTFSRVADGDDGWWLGFDCAHSGDAPSPEYIAKEAWRGYERSSWGDDHYWTVDEVRRETDRLAEQLASVNAEVES